VVEATRRLDIELPEDLAEAVTARVESGRFANASEVIQEGLRLLDEADEPLEPRIREELTAGYDEWRTDPTGGVPLDEATARLDEERRRARG
jgi:antitoxin ParD1/3/4